VAIDTGLRRYDDFFRIARDETKLLTTVRAMNADTGAGGEAYSTLTRNRPVDFLQMQEAESRPAIHG
jgi:hypothetical protein